MEDNGWIKKNSVCQKEELSTDNEATSKSGTKTLSRKIPLESTFQNLAARSFGAPSLSGRLLGPHLHIYIHAVQLVYFDNIHRALPFRADGSRFPWNIVPSTPPLVQVVVVRAFVRLSGWSDNFCRSRLGHQSPCDLWWSCPIVMCLTAAPDNDAPWIGVLLRTSHSHHLVVQSQATTTTTTNTEMRRGNCGGRKIEWKITHTVPQVQLCGCRTCSGPISVEVVFV